MAVWLTSDPHFGHERVATEHRHFGNADAHDNFIIRSWMKRVRDNDTIIVAGDISSGSSTAERRSLEIIRYLPGDKIAVLGNHDSPHPSHGSRSIAWESAYRDVFGIVRTHHFFRFDGIRFIVSHFPFEIDHTGESRGMLWRFPRSAADGKVLLHGHTHQSTPWTSPTEISVGLDAWNFAPVEIGEIVRKFREKFGDSAGLASDKKGIAR